MSLELIYNSIFSDQKYIQYCKKILPKGDTYKDLWQYVCLSILEMDKSKIKMLYDTGGLKMYIVRVIYINGKSNNSHFFRSYNEKQLDIIDLYNYDNEDTNELIEKINIEIEKEISIANKKNLYPVSVKLLEIYSQLGSYKKVSDSTGINYKTVQRHIKYQKNKIIKSLK